MSPAKTRDSGKQPNLLVILTDQQSASMMSCTGNASLKTPAMDRLAASGVRFERAYAANPVCLPSRFSLMTGRFPSDADIRCNVTGSQANPSDAIVQTSLGHCLRQAGYETAYGGKVHLPKGMWPTEIGFEYICQDEREDLADACAGYLAQPHEKPFCLVASLINPHDICYMAIRDEATYTAQTTNSTDALPGQMSEWLLKNGLVEQATLDEALVRPKDMDDETFFRDHCPPLPANLEPQENEPAAIGEHLDQRSFRRHVREHWTDEDWRLHRWAYARLTERVDAQVGTILDALEANGLLENTVVIFTSDHGDMDAAHRMEHKDVPYEEAVRIPLLVSHPSAIPAGIVNHTHLVSNGLDLLPTLCDYAGIAAPEGLQGESFRPIAEEQDCNARTALPIETENSDLILTERYKYVFYHRGENREQLYDRHIDPGEMHNCATDANYEGILQEHRALFAEAFPHAAAPATPAQAK